MYVIKETGGSRFVDVIHNAQSSQQTQNMCITFVQRRPNVFDVGPTLYKCHTNIWCLLVAAFEPFETPEITLTWDVSDTPMVRLAHTSCLSVAVHRWATGVARHLSSCTEAFSVTSTTNIYSVKIDPAATCSPGARMIITLHSLYKCAIKAFIPIFKTVFIPILRGTTFEWLCGTINKIDRRWY